MEEQRWLRQAEKDLESARDSSKAEHYEWACFQSQQAAEKALKAFLYSKGLRAILTHSIRDLVLDCSKYEKDFSNLLSQGKALDAYYISTRYPNGLVGNEIPAQYYSEEDASQCISYAELILRTVKKFMSK
jgi:HEPN domain-containing protein